MAWTSCCLAELLQISSLSHQSSSVAIPFCFFRVQPKKRFTTPRTRDFSTVKIYKHQPIQNPGKWTILDLKLLRCYPQQLESFCVFAIKSAYAIKIKCLCHKKHRNPLEFHKASAPEPSGTSQGICTETFRNLTRSLHRNLPDLTKYLPRNPPEPHHTSSPRPSGTSSSSCTGNFRNLSRYLHQNPLEPNQVSAP